jgi:hypothetical protein
VALDHIAEARQEVVRDDLEQRAAVVGEWRMLVYVDPVVAIDMDERAAIVDQQSDWGALCHRRFFRYYGRHLSGVGVCGTLPTF